MPLMNTFTFLTFTRPLVIPFYAEVGYSILTETFIKSFFLVSDKKFLILFIIMPDYNYGIF